MDMSFDRSGSYAAASLAIAGALGLGMVLLLFLPALELQKVAPRELEMVLA